MDRDAWLFVMVGSILLAIGTMYLVQFGNDTRKYATLDTELQVLRPLDDFSSMTMGCTIVNATWLYANQTTQEIRVKQMYTTVDVSCEDHFVYYFTLDSQLYRSGIFHVTRNGSKSCDERWSDRATAPFSSGDTVSCWLPVEQLENKLDTLELLTYQSAYNCGNSFCYKVLDPRDAWNDHFRKIPPDDVVDWRLPFGVVMAVVGLLCCCTGPVGFLRTRSVS